MLCRVGSSPENATEIAKPILPSLSLMKKAVYTWTKNKKLRVQSATNFPNTQPLSKMPSEDLQEPLVERLSATPDAEAGSAQISKKRKRGTKVQVAPKDGVKKAKSKKAKREEEDGLDLEAGINTAFATMDNQLVSDYIAQKTRKFESDLSSIELEDKYIPGQSPQFRCSSQV